MRWLRWQPGRQGTHYEKMLLATAKLPLPFDLYLLRYRRGAFVYYHRDPAPAGRAHYRLNVFLKRADAGGEFLVRGPVIADWPRLQLFRPDLVEHAVTPVERGTRVVLSLGWLR